MGITIETTIIKIITIVTKGIVIIPIVTIVIVIITIVTKVIVTITRRGEEWSAATSTSSSTRSSHSSCAKVNLKHF